MRAGLCENFMKNRKKQENFKKLLTNAFVCGILLGQTKKNSPFSPGSKCVTAVNNFPLLYMVGVVRRRDSSHFLIFGGVFH